MQQSVIALGAQEMDDLSKLPRDRRAFYAAYAAHHGDDGPVAIRGIGGKFFRFIHEITRGDTVLYPCTRDRQIYVGKVAGGYIYDNAPGAEFPHRRSVLWQSRFPKSALSEYAAREIGAARTLFALKRYPAEIRQLIEQAEPLR